MTTRTAAAPAPRTATEARSLAAQLEAAEQAEAARLAEQARFDALDPAEKRAEVRQAATLAEWQRIRHEDLPALDDALTAAAAAWTTASADPSVGLVELFALFSQLRTASATRAVLGHASAAALRNGPPSGPTPSGLDAWAGVTFADAVESVLAHRVKAAADPVSWSASSKVQAAAETAAATVKD